MHLHINFRVACIALDGRRASKTVCPHADPLHTQTK